jgi:hypothetical protein
MGSNLSFLQGQQPRTTTTDVTNNDSGDTSFDPFARLPDSNTTKGSNTSCTTAGITAGNTDIDPRQTMPPNSYTLPFSIPPGLKNT